MASLTYSARLASSARTLRRTTLAASLCPWSPHSLKKKVRNRLRGGFEVLDKMKHANPGDSHGFRTKKQALQNLLLRLLPARQHRGSEPTDAPGPRVPQQAGQARPGTAGRSRGVPAPALPLHRLPVHGGGGAGGADLRARRDCQEAQEARAQTSRDWAGERPVARLQKETGDSPQRPQEREREILGGLQRQAGDRRDHRTAQAGEDGGQALHDRRAAPERHVDREGLLVYPWLLADLSSPEKCVGHPVQEAQEDYSQAAHLLERQKET